MTRCDDGQRGQTGEEPNGVGRDRVDEGADRVDTAEGPLR